MKKKIFLVLLTFNLLFLINFSFTGCDGCGDNGEEQDSGVDIQKDVTEDISEDIEKDIGTDVDDSDDPQTCSWQEFVTGTGCGDGEKCTTYFPDESDQNNYLLACMPVSENMPVYHESCELLVYEPTKGLYDSCSPGFVCLSDGEEAICEKLCSNIHRDQCDNLVEGNEAACIWKPEIDLDPNKNALLCKEFDNCDMLCQTGCSDDTICYVGGDGISYGTVCASFVPLTDGNNGGDGELCEEYNNCNTGFLCHNSEEPAKCRPICNTIDNAECDFECQGEQTCTAITWTIEGSTPYTPDENLGICLE